MPKKTPTSRAVSHSKLLQAFADAGISTQVELVDKIVEIFPDASPAYSVGRMYRGKPVSLKTIAYVTRALNIDINALYDDEPDEEENEEEIAIEDVNETDDKSHKLRYLIIAIIVIAIILVGWVFTEDSLSTSNADNNFQIKFASATSSPIVAVVGEDELGFNDFSVALNQASGANVTVIKSDVDQISDSNIETYRLTDLLNVDVVLRVSIKEQGRNKAIFIHGYDKERKILLFADVFSKVQLNNAKSEIVRQTTEILTNRLDRKAQNIPLTTNEDSVSSLMVAFDFFDGATEISAISVASTHIYRALKHSPDYVKAKISLCQAQVALATIQASKDLLSEADETCNSLTQQAVNSPRYYSALGYLARKEQDDDLAIEYYKKANEVDSTYIGSMLGLAETYLTLMLQTRDIEYAKKAIALTEQAATIEPDFWRPPFVKARILYMMGQTEQALAENRKSVALDSNYTNLSNLATINFCFGDPKDSQKLYEQVTKMQFIGALAYYNLSSIQSFFGNFEAAVASSEKYLESLDKNGAKPSLEGYVGVADNYRLSGRLEKASEYYDQAYALAEQSRIGGDDSKVLQVIKTYIEVFIALASKNAMEEQDRQKFIEQMNAFRNEVKDPNSKMRLIFLYLALDERDSAAEIYEEIKPLCKGFAETPLLNGLST